MIKEKKPNSGIFYLVISLLAVLLIAGGAVAYSVSNNVVVEGDQNNFYNVENQVDGDEVSFGAFPGPDIYADIDIHGSLTHGGGYLATTTGVATLTLTYKDLEPYTYIDVMNDAVDGADDVAFTMPATSTMIQLLPDIGSARTWYFHNATSTGDNDPTLTIVKGAGMDLNGSDNAADAIDAEEWAKLTCMRIYYRGATDEDVMCLIYEFEDSD